MSDKKLSSFLEFEITEDHEPSMEEYGAATKVAHDIGSRLIAYVVCPLCSMHRKMAKNGRSYLQHIKRRGKKKSEIERLEHLLDTGGAIKSSRTRKYNPDKDTRFDTYNLEKAPFISLRVSHGRSSGFKEVEIIKLRNIKEMHEGDQEIVMDLVHQIREQCQKILDYTDKIVED